jgi:hypothetical protein
MNARILLSTAMLAIIIGILSPEAIAVAGQRQAVPPAAWTAPQTPWGDPDLQGIYTSDDYIGVPIQRPTQFGNRLYLTEEEIAERERQIERRSETDSREFAASDARVGTGPPGHWAEGARRPARQTSLIVDPADGRMPPLTPDGEKRQAQAAATRFFDPGERIVESWENFTFYIRCITRGVAGSILPVIYGNGTQIVQAPGYVAIVQEMVHEARIIPLDGRSHTGPAIRSYMGDSRGRWEGQTLVVETINVLPNTTGIGLNGGGTPTSDVFRLTERFTRVAPDTIQYEMTIDDPKTYTRPWTLAFPIRQVPGYELFEYACHEGNHGMMNQLSAARAVERATAEALREKQ